MCFVYEAHADFVFRFLSYFECMTKGMVREKWRERLVGLVVVFKRLRFRS